MLRLLDEIATTGELISYCDVLEQCAMRVGDGRDVDEIHLTTRIDVNSERRIEFDVDADARLAAFSFRDQCRLVPPDESLDAAANVAAVAANIPQCLDEFNDAKLRAGVSPHSIRLAASRAPSGADALPPTRQLRALSRNLAVRSSLWSISRFSIAHQSIRSSKNINNNDDNDDDNNDNDAVLPDVNTVSYEELPFVAAVRRRQRAAERCGLEAAHHVTLNDASRCLQLVYMSQICEFDLLSAGIAQRRRVRYHLRSMDADDRNLLASYRKAFVKK